MTTNVETLCAFFAAINRADLAAVGSLLDPDVVRIEPDGFPTAGTYRGAATVLEHVRRGRGTWAEGSCDPEQFLVNDDKVVVYLHARIRLNGSSEWIDGRFADGFVLRGGRVTEYLSFGEREAALVWAGLTDSAPPANQST